MLCRLRPRFSSRLSVSSRLSGLPRLALKPPSIRQWSSSPPGPAITEQTISEKLRLAFAPTKLEVSDTSGGCGAFFQINIESPKFAGQSLVKQHRMVNEVLAADIKNIHGVTLVTQAPKA